MATSQQLQLAHRQSGHLKLHGDGITYRHIRYGSNAGMPATCVDLHFCNLECQNCPDSSMWDKTDDFYASISDLRVEDFHQRLRKVQQDVGIDPDHHEYYAYITGGEPLIQQEEIANVLDAFPRYSIGIRTNGTVLLHPSLMQFLENVHIDCMPRLTSSQEAQDRFYKTNVLQQLAGLPNTTFCFTIRNEEDLEDYKNLYYQLLPTRRTITYAPSTMQKHVLDLRIPCVYTTSNDDAYV